MTESTKVASAKKENFTLAVGRRKESVARVRVSSGTGVMTVNNKPADEYFVSLINKNIYNKPFELTQTMGKYGTSVKVTGGGMAAQLDAVVHGIARALSKLDVEKFRPVLKSSGLLTRDPRAKERRKYGLAHAARAKKQSPKR